MKNEREIPKEDARPTEGHLPCQIHREKPPFTLLEYLMRNAGILLTRQMILEQVWDINTDLFTNTVEVHIRFLRRRGFQA